jgi:hypothetical protein
MYIYTYIRTYYIRRLPPSLRSVYRGPLGFVRREVGAEAAVFGAAFTARHEHQTTKTFAAMPSVHMPKQWWTGMSSFVQIMNVLKFSSVKSRETIAAYRFFRATLFSFASFMDFKAR